MVLREQLESLESTGLREQQVSKEILARLAQQALEFKAQLEQPE
jgi:hypothetical protein